MSTLIDTDLIPNSLCIIQIDKHAHTHSYTTQTLMHVNTNAYICAHTFMQTHIHSHTHTSNIHSYKRTHTHLHTHTIPISTSSDMYTLTSHPLYIFSRTHTQSQYKNMCSIWTQIGRVLKINFTKNVNLN